MSILIKGMYMPRMCSECAFMGGLICPDNVYTCDCPVEDDVCGVNITQAVDEDCKHPDCPLVEIPTPHGRLIDADALIDLWHGCEVNGDIKPIIDARQTIIEAEDE